MRLLIAATLLVAVNAAATIDGVYHTCSNEKTDMGRTEVMMIKAGETHTLRCPVKLAMHCRWFHDNMEMPSTMGNIAISTAGHLRFKSATWYNSGQYTVDVGNHYITYHIIVMPQGLTEMDLVIPEDHMVRNMEFRNMFWYNRYLTDIVFENVVFHNMHWQMMRMKNVKFVNCTFHWDEDSMYPMQAEFSYCKFEHTAWNRPHMKDCSFHDCSFSGGHHIDNTRASDDKYYTFFMHHIHNTVFCNVNWYDTNWALGRWYNVTFNSNLFTHHNHYEDRYENFHYKNIACRDFDATMDTMVQWTIDSDDQCDMIVHRPDSTWYGPEKCVKPKNKMVKYICGQEHSSTRFWDCTFEECEWDHCHMDSIEWRHVWHHKSQFMRSEMIANHFVMTHHKYSHWTQMTLSRWNRFTANSFNDHENHWTSAHNVSHHSCKFYHHSWDCRNCNQVSFTHCMMENVKMADTCKIKVWHMHDCTTLGMVMQGSMGTYQYCRVYHNDISWINYQMTTHEDACPMDYSMHHHDHYHCQHHPHDHTCAHMWMNPEHHCCEGYMSCHMMPHFFWMRNNMQCRENDYEFSWRMGEWRDSAARDMYYMKWSTSEYDPHSWSTHHKLPMVHCLNAMKKPNSGYGNSMTIRHIQRDAPTAMTGSLMEMMSMYKIEDPNKFYKMWSAKMTQFYDHWQCLNMFEY